MIYMLAGKTSYATHFSVKHNLENYMQICGPEVEMEECGQPLNKYQGHCCNITGMQNVSEKKLCAEYGQFIDFRATFQDIGLGPSDKEINMCRPF